MWLFEGLAELIAPTRCAGCELPGSVLCGACEESLPRVEPSRACEHCGAPYGALVCTECWDTAFAFEAAICLGELSGALARAVVLHKDAGERRLGAVLGGLLGVAAREGWGSWGDAVCWIPPTSAAIARRGFDHGKSIADPVARVLELPALGLLSRRRARDQRALGRAARLSGAQGSFSANGRPPARVVIVDDVLTTGATVDAAAQVLLAGGATEVRAAVIARAW